MERLLREIGRRTDVVGIFPNAEAALRLTGAILLEQHEEWMASQPYFSQESMAKLYARSPQGRTKARGRRNCPTSRRNMRCSSGNPILHQLRGRHRRTWPASYRHVAMVMLVHCYLVLQRSLLTYLPAAAQARSQNGKAAAPAGSSAVPALQAVGRWPMGDPPRPSTDDRVWPPRPCLASLYRLTLTPHILVFLILSAVDLLHRLHKLTM